MATQTQDATIPQDIANTLVDPRAYADGRADEALRWLRANNPLGLARPDGYEPFWVVTRHADIAEVGGQNKLFHNGDKQIILTTREDAERMYAQRESGNASRNLIQMDPPQHGKYRMMTQSWFMPSNLRKLEPQIREIARKTVAKLLATGGECEYVTQIAHGYPLHVIMTILGVPQEDEPLMLKLTQEIFSPNHAGDENSQLTPEQKRDKLQAAVAEFHDYFGKLSADRQKNPTDDLATVIANAQIGGEPIPLAERIGYYILVSTAGHDTTANATAGCMLALTQFPEEFAKVKADPALLHHLAEEAIRWTTPVKHFMRSAVEDTVLAGRNIAAGDLLMLSFLSANRDEAVFEDPYTFKADRQPNPHLGFGHGAHVCLGQFLARMEIRILMEEMLPHLKSVSLTDTPRLAPVNFISGPEYIPLKFEAA
ncbi:cytochrome P450 [Novosphingobium bradum]|uniref:Cytochrome P450 n=1 Tax=Novosphingobium bradum TaxID=1737444 RepID=A0ABV7IJL2_9SPHN